MVGVMHPSEQEGLLEPKPAPQGSKRLVVGIAAALTGAVILAALVLVPRGSHVVADAGREESVDYVQLASSGVEELKPPAFHWQSGIKEMETSAGFSWYTRIFTLIQEDTPVNAMQMGMAGTWLKPTNIKYDTCVCDPNGWPSANKDDQAAGCCDRPDDYCSWLFQTIEGGPGYWPQGQLPTKMTKWRNVATSGCYSGGAQIPLFWYGGKKVECDKMGTIQLSNRFLMAPDGITFARQGLFGVGFVRTPVGKTNKDDYRSFWALVVNAEGFSGPVAYFLPEIWAQRQPAVEKESAHIKDWGHSSVGMTSGGGFGFEWIPTQTFQKAGIIKIPKMAVPVNAEGRSHFAAGAQGYEDEDIYHPLEAALYNKQSFKAESLMKSGRPLGCDTHDGSANFNVNEGDSVSLGKLHTEKRPGGCTWSMLPTNKTGVFPQYYRASDLSPVHESAAPEELRAQEFNAWPTHTLFDARDASSGGGGGSGTAGPISGCGYKANANVGWTGNEKSFFIGKEAGWQECCARCRAQAKSDPPCVAWVFIRDGYCYSKLDGGHKATFLGGDSTSGSDAGIIEAPPPVEAADGCSVCGKKVGDNIGWTGKEEVVNAPGWKECCDECKSRANGDKPCAGWVYGGGTVCYLKYKAGHEPHFTGEDKPHQIAGILALDGDAASMKSRCSTKNSCMYKPGPVDDALHCVQTLTPSWIAYRWYRFIDQPGFQNLLLSEEEKDYMQSRVEWLHGELSGRDQWMKAPDLGGAAEPLVKVDPAQIVEPPAHMRKGYVPIAVYEGVEKPEGCSN